MAEQQAGVMPFRILVTGSRDWPDRLAVYRALDSLCDERGLNYPPDEYGNTMPDAQRIVVVHGDCPTGADRDADQWCLSNHFTAETYPANWVLYGKRAGFVRNAEMVALGADICLAFIKDGSKGATMTADLAERAGIAVRRYRPEGGSS